MRRLVVAVVTLVGLTSPLLAQIKNIETEGNLTPTRFVGRISAEQADVMLSPADLAESILACFVDGQDARAAELLILMQLRAAFDAARVADQTARQGGQVLSLTLR